MATEHSASTSIPTGAISFLERATHFPTVLLILSFLLAVDTGLSLGYRSNLLSLSWDFVQQHITIGAALLFILIFGLYMSIGVILLRHLADQIAWNTVGLLWDKLFPREVGHSPYCGAVRPYKLREEAHVEQNKFYLDLYNEHKVLKVEKKNNEWQVSSTAFACLLLGVVNYFVLPHFGYLPFSSQLAIDLPSVWGWCIGILFVLLLSVWLYPLLHDDMATDWVYCLPLYRKLEDEQRKRKELLSPSRY